MKPKETSQKILSQIKEGKLFNTKMVLLVDHLFAQNQSKISRAKIKNTISNLNKQGEILVKDNKIVPFENFFVGPFNAKKFGGSVIVSKNGEKIEYPVASSEFKKIPNNTIVGFTVDPKADKKVAHIANIISFHENSLYGNVKVNKRGQTTFIPDFNPYSAKFVLEDNNLAKQAIGKKCKVKIVSSSSTKDKFSVIIENQKDIFGDTLSPLGNIEAVLSEEGVTRDFQENVARQARQLPKNVMPIDLEGRKDYRNKNIFSIDPATAQDMDDATGIEAFVDNNGKKFYKEYIAIADISHYVPEGSPLDLEALYRAFSIYPAGGVVPMFPKELSEEICSLVEKEDRLVMMAEVLYDENGEVVEYDFHEGVINSRKKLSYDTVQKLHDKELNLEPEEKDIENSVELMYELTDKITKINERKGTLSLSGYQPTIILDDEKSTVVDFINKNNLESTKIIEKPMVAFNVAAASLFKELGVPFISRSHEAPNPSRFEELINYMYFLGLDFGFLEPSNKALVTIAKAIKGHFYEKVMSSKLVRTMSRAKYSINPEAYHFALAEDNYTHFTAGIRRYIDITNHRTLKKVLNLYKKAIDLGELDKDLPISKNASRFAMIYKEQLANLQNIEKLAEIVDHLNQREEKYDKIEGKTRAICAALFMQKNIGQDFSAYISSVEKDFVIATLKDEADPLHSDIIEVILPLKDLIKNKKVFIDPKTLTVNEHGTAKIIYHSGKKLNLKITDIDLVEGKILAKDDYITKFENSKLKENNAKATTNKTYYENNK